MIIPFNVPFLSENAYEYVKNALRSRKHCGNYTYAQKSIELMKETYDFHEVFLTTSCTTAMEFGALLAELKSGEEVIMPSYTFSSTANAVVLRGAKPVFCEVTPDTMNIDVSTIESLITERTKMIAPIDYAGIPCEIETIMKLAEKYNLTVMQDAAQSFHSFHKNGKPCGTVPTMAAFSFHETKNINCGEGGALVIKDPNLIERANFLQEKGTDRSLVLKGVKSKYSWVDLGSSFLLSDILAAMLLSQLEHVEKIVEKRSVVTNVYKKLFKPYSDNGCLKMPVIPEGTVINNHAYFVIFDDEKNQEQFISLLKEKNIYAYIGYLPLHSSPMGRKYGYQANDLPITEDLASRIVRLPFYTELQGDSLEYCIDGMQSVLRSIYDI